MNTHIKTNALTQEAFADFGDVIATKEAADKIINQGRCGRHHNMAKMDFSDGRVGISLFKSDSFTLPFSLDMMERHPAGSQAFIPMYHGEYLVVVAADDNGKPTAPIAFIASPGQAVNIARNVWHGVLCPLSDPGLFAVADRIGDGANLEEHWYDTPIQIEQG